MKIEKDQIVNVSVVEDKICNICEQSLKGPNNFFIGKTFEYNGEFDSYALEDMTTYEWDVCEKCLADWFKTFKIKPTEKEYGCI